MMRSSHHGVVRIWRTQVSDMFQSSLTSWSSKIIVVGTVERSHLVTGSLQASPVQARVLLEVGNLLARAARSCRAASE